MMGCEYCRNEAPLFDCYDNESFYTIREDGMLQIDYIDTNIIFDYCPRCGCEIGDDNE